jgi:hypothetical protein
MIALCFRPEAREGRPAKSPCNTDRITTAAPMHRYIGIEGQNPIDIECFQRCLFRPRPAPCRRAATSRKQSKIAEVERQMLSEN